MPASPQGALIFSQRHLLWPLKPPALPSPSVGCSCRGHSPLHLAPTVPRRPISPAEVGCVTQSVIIKSVFLSPPPRAGLITKNELVRHHLGPIKPSTSSRLRDPCAGPAQLANLLKHNVLNASQNCDESYCVFIFALLFPHRPCSLPATRLSVFFLTHASLFPLLRAFSFQ